MKSTGAVPLAVINLYFVVSYYLPGVLYYVSFFFFFFLAWRNLLSFLMLLASG